MQEATLPSPDTGSNGYHLRRVAVKNISQLEIVATSYPGNSHPGAVKLADFFDACAAAAREVGKITPTLTLTPATSTGAPASTEQLTLTKGGSTGAATYSTSDAAIATVNGAGLVTRVAVGTATITASVAATATHRAGTVTASVTVA